MQRKHAWSGKQAFGKGSNGQTEIDVDAHRRAADYLHSTLLIADRIPVLRGPSGSARHKIVHQFSKSLSRNAACAVVDGSKLQPAALLAEAMRGFGYVTDLKSVEEHLHMVNVFAMQQVRTCQAPTLIVENIDQMFPSALRILSILATLSVNGRPAIRMVLTSERDPASILSADGMLELARRLEAVHEIQPLSAVESMKYLHARLVASGVRNPDSIFPIDVCDRLHERSGGWPHRLDTCAMEAIERGFAVPLEAADTGTEEHQSVRLSRFPAVTTGKSARQSPPVQLIVSKQGQPPFQYTLTENRVLIGRSKLADVMLDEKFVSNAHALLLLYGEGLVLMDLNSRNGTYVNSVRTRTVLLKSDDIISLGFFRIKIRNAPAWDEKLVRADGLVDTAKMKNLQEMRQLKRRVGPQRHRRRKSHA